jgi:hypothetical protein
VSVLAAAEEQDPCRYRDAAQDKDMNDPTRHGHGLFFPL